MEVIVRPLTDSALVRRACKMTMHGQESKVTLKSLYRAEHNPIRCIMFWAELHDIPIFVSVHLVRHTRYHFLQTLTGEITDGYSGCPGIGPKRAEGILNNFTDHPAETFDAKGAWEAIVKIYEKAKLEPEEALTQARAARICHVQDYDFKEK